MLARAVIGPLLLLVGVYLYLNRGETLSPGEMIGYFWPSLFVIPLSLFFHWLYFSVLERRGSGLLIPGGVLFTVGVFCQIAMLLDNWAYIWPGFILAPALGLFEFFWFGGRNKYLLIPINILTVLSLMFFVLFSLGALFNRFVLGKPLLAILFILAGALLMVAGRRRRA
ncbi:hypothetical protein IDH44_16900 [Paenibacillus sp. IB182496]|uniref:DUF5668 domain-containing protein n=1 Tax=Paenibacillus sabuli TaxID=2772509 RepID=A0A927BV32_9BACL|nr:hypothetical protein [Paenibacillus sabuli]MBD2846877.1 hypothetical protein [Paenibacillus sabuli]